MKVFSSYKSSVALSKIDYAIKNSLGTILNIYLNDKLWSQAALAIEMGSLGIRKVEDITLSSFSSSTFGSKDFVSQIMNNNSSDKVLIHHFEDAINKWNELNPNRIPANPENQHETRKELQTMN